MSRTIASDVMTKTMAYHDGEPEPESVRRALRSPERYAHANLVVRPSARLEDVPDAADRVEQLGLEVAIDLLAQSRDEHIHHVGAWIEVVAPDMREDHRLGEHASLVAKQILE